jgi:hypothetical protein
MKRQLTLIKKAKVSIEPNAIIMSDKDREVFFNAFMNLRGPNKKLRDAAECYKKFMKGE